MDNQDSATEPAVLPAGSGVPVGAAAGVARDTADRPVPPADAMEERNGIFRQLVAADSDIAGLVAYSIYKQNKLDWLTAFEAAKARAPNADELASYIIGEGTPRRIATYRHLAEATLAGTGPEVGGASRPAASRAIGAGKTGIAPTQIALYVLVALLFAIGFLLAAHYTVTSR